MREISARLRLIGALGAGRVAKPAILIVQICAAYDLSSSVVHRPMKARTLAGTSPRRVRRHQGRWMGKALD